MPRGPTSRDRKDFAAAVLPKLRAAAADLRWLLHRGYGMRGALRIVGNRHRLRKRQRRALYRSVCPPAEAAARRTRLCSVSALHNRHLCIDGYNCLIITECLLAGGIVLQCDDGAVRDVQGIFGSYRITEHTAAALEAVATILQSVRPQEIAVILDARMRYARAVHSRWEQTFRRYGLPISVHPVETADPVLMERGHTAVVASSDGPVMDDVRHVTDLPAAVAEHRGIPLLRIL